MTEWHNETSETQTTHETGPHCRCCDLGGGEDRQRESADADHLMRLRIRPSCDITAHLLRSCPPWQVCAAVSGCACASWRSDSSYSPPASSDLRARGHMLATSQSQRGACSSPRVLPLSLLSCSEVEEEALESPSCSPLTAPLSSLAGWSSSEQGAGRKGLT